MAKTAERGSLELRDSRLFFGAGSVSEIVDEFKQASRWSKGLWVVAVLVGILDVLRWHHGAGFSADSLPAWQSAHGVLHGRGLWNGFVYLPGCLLFLFPLALFPFVVTKYLVYAIQVLGLGYLFWALTRMIRVPLGSVRVAWAALAVVLCGELGIAAFFENFTVLLLPLAAAFYLAIDRDRQMAAAVILGVSLTVKPLLAPLLVVLLVSRRWRESAVAVLIPLVLSAIALLAVVAASADPSAFWHNVLNTFSRNAGKPWNISLSAMAGYLHASHAVGDLARLLVVVVSLVACWRIWRHPREDGGVQAVLLTAPLLVIEILCFSFSWGYYCLLLLPLGFVSLRGNRIADWVVRVGVFLAMAPPILANTIPSGYPDRYYQYTSDHISGLGIALNGILALGVLIALAGTLLYAFADELPPAFQKDLGGGRPRTTTTSALTPDLGA